MEGSMSVVCKLWGDSTNIDVPPVDTILTAQHMEVSQYKGTIYLNSSVLSSLKVSVLNITWIAILDIYLYML